MCAATGPSCATAASMPSATSRGGRLTERCCEMRKGPAGCETYRTCLFFAATSYLSRSRSLLSFGRRESRGGSPWLAGRRISWPLPGPFGLSSGGGLFIGGFDGLPLGGLLVGGFGLSSGGRLLAGGLSPPVLGLSSGGR